MTSEYLFKMQYWQEQRPSRKHENWKQLKWQGSLNNSWEEEMVSEQKLSVKIVVNKLGKLILNISRKQL